GFAEVISRDAGGVRAVAADGGGLVIVPEAEFGDSIGPTRVAEARLAPGRALVRTVVHVFPGSAERNKRRAGRYGRREVHHVGRAGTGHLAIHRIGKLQAEQGLSGTHAARDSEPLNRFAGIELQGPIRNRAGGSGY